MNKRGYIKILEAIVALIIVLSYVISILPKAPQPTGEAPPELVAIQKTIIDSVQNDQRFRSCIVYGNLYLTDETDPAKREKSDMECVDEIVKSSLPPFSVWQYAFKICTTPPPQPPQGTCKYTTQEQNGQPLAGITDDRQFAETLPQSGAVYTKSVFVNVADVTSAFTTTEKPESERYKTITLQMWSTV